MIFFKWKDQAGLSSRTIQLNISRMHAPSMPASFCSGGPQVLCRPLACIPSRRWRDFASLMRGILLWWWRPNQQIIAQVENSISVGARALWRSTVSHSVKPKPPPDHRHPLREPGNGILRDTLVLDRSVRHQRSIVGVPAAYDGVVVRGRREDNRFSVLPPLSSNSRRLLRERRP
jgi:hypothetical protein